MADDGFVVVARRKRNKGEMKKYTVSDINQWHAHSLSTIQSVDEICQLVERRRQELDFSGFTGNTMETLAKSGIRGHVEVSDNVRQSESVTQTEIRVDSIVCYGIGNFADNAIASYQMSLLLALKENLQVPSDECFVFDPVLCGKEREALLSLGFKVLQQNEECKRLATSSTLFYMPHCGKAMYNNLLWRNWRPEHLQNVKILGNSFSTIVQSTPRRILKAEASYIERISDVVQEYSIPNTFSHTDVFNNTSLHVFPPEVLKTAAVELWDANEEPCYEDRTEIITDRDMEPDY